MTKPAALVPRDFTLAFQRDPEYGRDTESHSHRVIQGHLVPGEERDESPLIEEGFERPGHLMSATADRGNPSYLTIKIEHIEQGVRVRLSGTADIATLSELETGLARFNLDGQHSVQIDVSDLSFIDVIALRRLISFAIAAKESGHTVTTHGARPVLHKMAQALNVRDELGLS